MPSDPEPSYALCVAQASMIYGVPPLTALSATALIYEVRSVLSKTRRTQFSMHCLFRQSWLVITGQGLPEKSPEYARRNAMVRISVVC